MSIFAVASSNIKIFFLLSNTLHKQINYFYPIENNSDYIF